MLEYGYNSLALSDRSKAELFKESAKRGYQDKRSSSFVTFIDEKMIELGGP
jgi:hypothetical protein